MWQSFVNKEEISVNFKIFSSRNLYFCFSLSNCS